MNGLTGPINFDARGFRTDFNLDIIELKQEGLVKVTIFLLEYLNHIDRYLKIWDFYNIATFELCFITFR